MTEQQDTRRDAASPAAAGAAPVAPERPAGKVVFRKLRNLRPGQVVWPVGWKGTEQDGHPTEWAHVEGHAMTLDLESMLSGRQRRVTRVAVRYPHEERSFWLEGQPGDDVRVIIPPELAGGVK